MNEPSSAAPRPHSPVARHRPGTSPFDLLRRRVRTAPLPPPSRAELEAMLAEYRARGGGVTACPDAYLLPVQNGAGRDARRWTR